MVIDGINLQVYEPRKYGFDPAWWSHKFNGPGVRYKIASCINTGDIVWLNGPFPCGKFPDLNIF
jgi:hypothetical protein